jgi:hypothetical protein
MVAIEFCGTDTQLDILQYSLAWQQIYLYLTDMQSSCPLCLGHDGCT